MSDLKADILKNFGHRLRIRVCGLCIQNNKLLLLKHHSIGKTNILWSPPGGGMLFGESVMQTLVREFKEETGLTPLHYEFAFVHEYLQNPLHAVELFFFITEFSGIPKLGYDPEMSNEQMLLELSWIDLPTLNAIPNLQKHFVLRNLKSWEELTHTPKYTFFNGENEPPNGE